MGKNQDPGSGINIPDPQHWTDGKIFHGDAQDGYDWGRMNLKSVTEDASYIDFLNTAEAAR